MGTMLKVPVDECPAGPEMDAAVARALGFKVQCPPWGDVRPVYLAGSYSNEYDGWVEHEDWRPVLPYSTDVATAWEVAPSILNGKHLVFMGTHWAIWHFEENDKLPNDAIGETAPLAIARAFLKANGVEFVEVPE